MSLLMKLIKNDKSIRNRLAGCIYMFLVQRFRLNTRDIFFCINGSSFVAEDKYDTHNCKFFYYFGGTKGKIWSYNFCKHLGK